MPRNRFALVAALALSATALLLWGLAAHAQGGDTYSSQAQGGPSTLPPGTFAGPCKPWVQVNDGAFGLDDPSGQSPPYRSEEGFEVAVFSRTLCVGMEADNQYGARIWCTRPGVRVAADQADWEQVMDDAFGNAANNDHIDSLEPFGGYLYASTAMQNETHDGTEVWRSDDLVAWTQVNSDGFGIPDARYNENFKDLARLTVEGTSYLCGGTLNADVGAQVWCTSGTLQAGGPALRWSQVNSDGFGTTDTVKVWSTAVLSGYLYAGTERGYEAGDGWQGLPGTLWRGIGAGDGDGWDWDVVYTAPVVGRVDAVGVFSQALYVGFGHPTSGTQIYRTTDGLNWTPAVTDGFGDPRNGRAIVDAATVYNGALYLATIQNPYDGGGAQVWRTFDGLGWTNVVTGGWTSTRTFAAELIPFNGHLYAWASDYVTGQRVLRTACPICQARAIDGPGRYDFAGVGAALSVTVESVDVVTACVYPGAPPTLTDDWRSIARHYEISGSLAGGVLTGDLTLSYDDEELLASDLGIEDTTYLARWSGDSWSGCADLKRERDAASNTVTCQDVTPFSTWAVSQTDQTPALKWQHGGCYGSWCETGWYASPAVADLDGDGSVEIIGSAYSIVALDGATGALEWRVKSGYDRTTDPDSVSNVGRTWPGIVVADVDDDGGLEIATAHGGGYVSVYDEAGYFEPGWPQRPTTRELRGLSTYDLEGDGTLEIIVTGAVYDEVNTWVYDHDGTLRDGWPQLSDDSGYAHGLFNDNVGVGDLDGDGAGEIVVPSDVHYVCAYEADGAQIPANGMYGDKGWGKVGVWESPETELRGWGTCSGSDGREERNRANFANGPANVVDVNGDGVMEVVVVGDVHDCHTSPYTDLYNGPYIFNADRSRFNEDGFDWTTVPTDTGAPLIQDYNVIENVQPNPATVDLDGDGELEILFPSYDGRMHAFWLDKTEHHQWPYAVHDPGEGIYRFASEPAVVDLDGDGLAEVVFTSWVEKGSESTGKLHVLDYQGAVLHEVDLPDAYSGDWNGALPAPTLAEIDGDADLEVVLNTAHAGLVAYDLPGTANAEVLWSTGRGNYQRTGASVVCYWADVDCDCDVDVGDITAVADHWRCATGEGCYDARYDVNRDGVVTVVDIVRVAAAWGWTCP